jgi:2-methylfumaryl-CoA hydratase
MKSSPGKFFEEFCLGQILRYATLRTLADGDVALITAALTGSRFASFSSDVLAHACVFPPAPVDPLLVFHVVFGKRGADVSLNAVVNLVYAEERFFKSVFVGYTVSAESAVVGQKEKANGKTGVVTVRTAGRNQHDELMLSYGRWMMVKKRDARSAAPEAAAPLLDAVLAGAPQTFEDYAVGKKLDHVDGMIVEEVEHQIAVGLYQNSASVHLDSVLQLGSRFGKRLIHGGVVISTPRALSFNWLANAGLWSALNGGRNVAPLSGGDRIHSWSGALNKAILSPKVGALRLRLSATKNLNAGAFALKNLDGVFDSSVILDLNNWTAIPARA